MAGFYCALSGLGNSVYLDYSHIQSLEGASYIYLGASPRELNTMKLPYEMTGNHITCAWALPLRQGVAHGWFLLHPFRVREYGWVDADYIYIKNPEIPKER